MENLTDENTLTEVRRNKFELASLVCGCMLIVFAIFGIVGNTFSFFIFAKSSKNISINILLAGQSIIDNVLLILGTPLFATAAFYAYIPNKIAYPIMNFLVYYTYPLSMMAQMATVLITVVITCERFMAVCKPLKAMILCTNKNAKRSLFLIILISIVYNLCRFWEFHLSPEYLLNENLRKYFWYTAVYYHWLYFIVIFLSPFAVLTVMNGFIIKKICKRNRQLRLQINRRIRREYQTSIMMVVITFSFLFCNVLAFLLKGFENFCFRRSSTFCDEDYYTFLIDLNNLLVEINSSIPFIIYVSFSRCFRTRFCKMMNVQVFRTLFSIELSKRSFDNYEMTSYYYRVFPQKTLHPYPKQRIRNRK